MNIFKQIITNAAGTHKAVLLSIILLISSINYTAQPQSKNITWQDIAMAYNKTFSTQANGEVLNANPDVLRATRLQGEKQIANLNNTITTATSYIAQNSFEEKILTQALATYKTAQNQLSAILYRYHSALAKLRTSQTAPLSIVNGALATMAGELQALIPLQKNINSVLQSLQNENLFSSFFDRRKDNKKNAQALLVNLLKKVYWAIDVTRDWTSAELQKNKKIIAAKAQQNAGQNTENAKARSAALQASNQDRRVQQQKLAAIDQEKASFENKLKAYQSNRNSTLSGAIKLARQYQPHEKETASDPAKAARYENYIIEIKKAEKEKFARDLEQFYKNNLSIAQLKSRWDTAILDAEDKFSGPRHQEYLQQINRAIAIKSGVSPDVVDLNMD